jgi:hypothetical protein
MKIEVLTIPTGTEFHINGHKVDSAGRLHIHEFLTNPVAKKVDDGVEIKSIHSNMDIALSLSSKQARLLAYEILSLTYVEG